MRVENRSSHRTSRKQSPAVGVDHGHPCLLRELGEHSVVDVDRLARLAILKATRGLQVESGYDRLTLEAVAERAGVGRQTVYRWWRSKSDVVAEAVLEGVVAVGARTTRPVPGMSLSEWLRACLRPLTGTEGASMVRALAAAAANDRRRRDGASPGGRGAGCQVGRGSRGRGRRNHRRDTVPHPRPSGLPG